MPLILASNSASGGYNVANSLRFNSASTDYLQRTPASAGSLTTWTYSFWTKRSKLATGEQYLSAGPRSAPNVEDQIYSISTDAINWYDGTANTSVLRTTQLFRDVSAWYHLMFVWNTTSATAGDRARIYVNGTEVTAFSIDNNPSLNAVSKINGTGQHRIGQTGTVSGENLDGYLAEVIFIDGQALTPSSFGETDTDTGIWKPKAYTGTYGTNGFYLQFKNSASLGTDSSGNGNTWTVNNLTSIDQSTDTPTNNFCTLNPLDTQISTGIAFAEGNLQITPDAAQACPTRSTIAVDKGKWYWEVKVVASTQQQAMIGIADVTSSAVNSGSIIGGDAKSYGYYAGTGEKYNNNSGAAYGATYTNGDIISVLLNMDSGTLVFYKNGTTQGTAYSSLSGIFSPAFSDGGGGSAPLVVLQTNFGNPPYSANSYTDGAGYGNFSYAVPSGYYSLNTKNLATYG